MRIRNATDETITIPPGETADVRGETTVARAMVKRIPIFVVEEVRSKVAP